MLKEKHKRSMLRSIIWRAIGIIFLALITYTFTKSWIQTGLITFLHHFAFIWIYYFHERFWQLRHLIRFVGKKRKVMRVFTYEIVLGHCILGLITLLITGSWISVTSITIIYIENKLWMYILYDYIWDKIGWGKIGGSK